MMSFSAKFGKGSMMLKELAEEDWKAAMREAMSVM